MQQIFIIDLFLQGNELFSMNVLNWAQLLSLAEPFLFCNYFKAVKLVGLLPTSHLYPVINAAPDSNVNLHEAKPLTLNMEFEMTRPMLDFLIRLHKNGDKPYDEVKVKEFFRTCNVLPFSCTHLALWRQGKRPKVHAKQKGFKNFFNLQSILPYFATSTNFQKP